MSEALIAGEAFELENEAPHWLSRIESSDEPMRLFHGRGQCYPGWEWLTIDYFKPLLWIVCYRPPEPEQWQALSALLKARFKGVCSAAIVQNRYDKPAVSYCLWGEIPPENIVVEAGAKFKVQLEGRQNIGYFMDMAPQRQWLGERVDERRVLNLFAYTCAFSVAAAQAGASEVLNVDMSKSALRQGQVNHGLNGLDSGDCKLRFGAWDVMRSWGRLRKAGPFDVIICDPPSRQAGSFDAEKDYAKLIRRLPDLLAPGADLLMCLNAPYLPDAFLQDLMAEHFPEAEFQSRLPGRTDFPEKDPERALKVLHYCWPG